jgi:F-type H+-transporting ATPase subunit alpha
MELLKQPIANSLSMPQQVVLLTCANAGIFQKIPTETIPDFKSELIAYFEENYPQILSELESSGILDDEGIASIVEAGGKFADDVAVSEEELEEDRQTKEEDTAGEEKETE